MGLQRDLASLDRDICQPLGRILQEVFGGTEHLLLKTVNADKYVKLNCRLFDPAADATAVAVDIEPGLEPACTVSCLLEGLWVKAYASSGSACAGVKGIVSNPILKGSGAAGNVSGEFLAVAAKVEEDSGSTRTVTGPAACFKAEQKLYGTVTNGVFALDVPAKGGSVAWTALLRAAIESGLAQYSAGGLTPGNVKGALTVQIGTNVLYLAAYDGMT